MKGVKGLPKRKKDKEVQAQRTAGHIAESETRDDLVSEPSNVHGENSIF